MSLKHYQTPLLLPIIFAALLIVFSCSKKSVPCGDPVPSLIEIALVDKNDSLLIGKKYDPDTIKLWGYIKDQRQDFYGNFNEGYITIFYSWDQGLDYTDNFYMYLSKDDIDTVNLKSSVRQNNCGNFYDLQGVRYNSKEVVPITYNKFRYNIRKD
jgi:hypothetical protein